MNQFITSTEMNLEGDRFLSLTALRSTHNQLLKQYHEQRNVPEVLRQIAAFIRKGKATGALLDNEEERWAAQGLLDYWSSMLYRAGDDPPNATLDAFDPADAPILDDSLCPYVNFESSQFQVKVLNASDWRTAIEQPAKLIGLRFEEGVVDALIQDTISEPDGWSLLQFLLLRLWEKRDRNLITWEHYQQMGRGRQAILHAADQLMEALSPVEQSILKQIMLNLAQFGTGPNLVKRKTSRSELYKLLKLSDAESFESNPSATASTASHQSSDQPSESTTIPHPEINPTQDKPATKFEELLQGLANDTSYRFESNSPEIQNRFQVLLAKRLRQEVEHAPPLFPWEAEVSDYVAEDSKLDAAEESAPPSFAASYFWLPQLSQISLPVAMSENLLAQLLARCQTVATSLKDGLKLVQAVEPFFPGQLQPLHQLSGMVLATSVRSGGTITESTRGSDFPKHYDKASLAQKMALSLLAAREIFKLFTFRLSSQQSIVERQWETIVGVLVLRIGYGGNELWIEGQFPCGGMLSLHQSANSRSSQASTSAQRSTPGSLRVALFMPASNETYAIEIRFNAPNDPCMTFTIQLEI